MNLHTIHKKNHSSHLSHFLDCDQELAAVWDLVVALTFSLCFVRYLSWSSSLCASLRVVHVCRTFLWMVLCWTLFLLVCYPIYPFSLASLCSSPSIVLSMVSVMAPLMLMLYWYHCHHRLHQISVRVGSLNSISANQTDFQTCWSVWHLQICFCAFCRDHWWWWCYRRRHCHCCAAELLSLNQVVSMVFRLDHGLELVNLFRMVPFSN